MIRFFDREESKSSIFRFTLYTYLRIIAKYCCDRTFSALTHMRDDAKHRETQRKGILNQCFSFEAQEVNIMQAHNKIYDNIVYLHI